LVHFNANDVHGVLKETPGTVEKEKEKKSRIFTRDRTSSSNKYKKSPMPKLTNDNDRTNAGTGTGGSGENVVSMVEVSHCLYIFNSSGLNFNKNLLFV